MIIGSVLIYHLNLTSTNSEASLLIKNGDPAEGTVIYTDFQTAGKGQPGNRWESEKGKNLLLSIILYPVSVLPEEQFLISMMVSLGLCDLLDNYSNINKIKWPNDIYAGDGKIAGILIENTIIGGNIGSTVVGTGLNVNQTDFTGNIPNPVSIKRITGKNADRDKVMHELLAALDKRYKQLLYGNRENLRDEYISRLYRFGEWHKFKSGKNSFSGRIAGVTASGKLRIEKRNSNVTEFGFREVDYII